MNLLEERIRSFRDGSCRVPSRLAVAVSGGKDSMCLLHALHSSIQQPFTAIHINHQLRDEDSELDQQLVENYCRDHQINLKVSRIHLQKDSPNLEENARILRYREIARIMDEESITDLFLAHHQDDQIETILMRLLRGTGLRGLTGIFSRTGFPVDCAPLDTSEWEIHRPFLHIPASDILEYVSHHKIPYREDHSNSDPRFLRNNIRHNLIGSIDQVCGERDWRKSLLNLSNIAGCTNEFLESCAADWEENQSVTIPDYFEELPYAIQYQVVLDQLRKHKIPHPYDRICFLLDHQDQWLSVAPDVRIQLNGEGILEVEKCQPPSTESLFPDQKLEIQLEAPSGHINFAGIEFKWDFVTHIGTECESFPNIEQFDADEIGSHCTLRFWQPGDQFHPIGLPGPVKLKKWFTNRKIERSERHRLVVAESATGEIFWVQGERIADWARCRSSTRRILRWAIYPQVGTPE